MEKLKTFFWIIAFFILSIVALQAEKLEKMVVVNIGEWQYQQNNPGYESNQCFWNTLNDANFDGTTYEAKNTDNPSGAEQPYLLDYEKNPTSLSIKTSDAFAGINRASGDAFPSGGAIYRFNEIEDLGFHCAVLNGSFFVSDDMDDEGAVLLSGFDTGYTYNLYAFCSGSRGEDESVNLETEITATGTNSQTGTQDANKNADKLIVFTGMVPSDGGTIEMRMRAGDNNDSSLRLAFFNSIFIETGEKRSDVASIYAGGVTAVDLMSVLGTQLLVKQDLHLLGMYDLAGKCVMSWPQVEGNTLLSLASLHAGVYMLRAETVDGVLQVVKFVKR